MRKIMLITLIISAILITGCSNTADIFWEDISITVEEVTLIPNEPNYEDKVFIHLVVKGNPTYDIYGHSVTQYFQIYDSEKQCSGFVSQIGSNENLLLKKEIDVYGWTDCYSKETPEKLKFIFRDSDLNGLDTISDEFTIKVKDSPSGSMNKIIEKWIEEQEEKEKEYQEELAQRKEEVEKQQANEEEYDKYYNEFYSNCIDSEEGLEEYLQNNDNLKLQIEELETDYQNCINYPDLACESPDRWGSLYDRVKNVDHYDLYVKEDNNAEEILEAKINAITEVEKQFYLTNRLKEHCEEKAKENVCDEHTDLCNEVSKNQVIVLRN